MLLPPSMPQGNTQQHTKRTPPNNKHNSNKRSTNLQNRTSDENILHRFSNNLTSHNESKK